MFKFKRVEKGEENTFTVSTPDGYIKIAGTDDFVVRMVKSLAENDEYLQIMRENFAGVTRADVAVEMKKAGFNKDIIQDFEDGIIWDDLIDDLS